MAATSLNAKTRLAGLALALALAGPGAPVAHAAAAAAAVITLLGDSISAGYGLAGQDALPAQLQAALARIGVSAQVRAAAVSGDTTADGLARLDFSVQPDTRLCVVELGGNDLLQGVEPRLTQANLAAILARLRARHIRALLLGLQAPPAMGAAYARQFDAAFPAAAKAQHTRLFPALLDGVAGRPPLNQQDGVHPNPAGVRIVARRLAPAVAAALAAPAP